MTNACACRSIGIENRSLTTIVCGLVWMLCILGVPYAAIGQAKLELLPVGERPSFGQLESPAVKGKVSQILQDISPSKSLDVQRGPVWVVAFYHPEGTVPRLKDLLAGKYDGRVLSDDEEKTLLDAVLALGFLAHRDEEAYRFLLQGTNPSYWKGMRKWNSQRTSEIGDSKYRDLVNDSLVSFSIQAIGISDRFERDRHVAREQLLGLRKRSPNYLHRFAGDIAQAEFYLSVRRRNEEPALWGTVLKSEDKTSFTQWAEREGSEIIAWANAQMRGPLPTE